METNRLLLIFSKNPVPGRCKTRLAKTIGDVAATEIYKVLLRHTALITEPLDAIKEVHYSDFVEEDDVFSDQFIKKVQSGSNLGEKMKNAFEKGFKQGYQHIIIIGTDLLDITTEDIYKAFNALQTYDYVLGPAEDGGYYLLGMNKLNSTLFENKDWSSNTVLQDTLIDLKTEQIALLDERNDIDTYEDLEEFKDLKDYLLKNN
ncbi:TIGR04282 family arsenosugar biosynthesis glycosyltransferase [uncultured Planktosalinus sp.]|uniref:TIGR04282 family arsenosugar biosynthesis glycosyltransferase n=1 Tax=uncultured Planktosalinus sp. TaxID=1810935 RepID=UPI0030DD421B|tara:strand:+ start:329 stop:940 length:612 start_codon:yes stop_codon:yes gene_type:complete